MTKQGWKVRYYCMSALYGEDFCHAEEAKSREEAEARMTAVYRGEELSFEDDGSPEHDD